MRVGVVIVGFCCPNRLELLRPLPMTSGIGAVEGQHRASIAGAPALDAVGSLHALPKFVDLSEGLGPWERSRVDGGLQIPRGFLLAAEFPGAVTFCLPQPQQRETEIELGGLPRGPPAGVVVVNHLLELGQVH